MKATTQNKDLDYYLSLPYTIELTPDDDGFWFARVPLLEGCISNGSDAHDALDMIQDAKRGWLITAIELGMAIPEPEPETTEPIDGLGAREVN